MSALLFSVRPAILSDLTMVTKLASALWPDEPASDHEAHAASILSGASTSTLPLVFFVAELEGQVIGFIEVGLRSHADGCDVSHPVGFLEGWYVVPQHQRRSVGSALVIAAEAWARAQGAREIASDTWIDAKDSQKAHEALGFEVVDRCVNYRKSLV